LDSRSFHPLPYAWIWTILKSHFEKHWGGGRGGGGAHVRVEATHEKWPLLRTYTCASAGG
jgi:hypothetical protein